MLLQLYINMLKTLRTPQQSHSIALATALQHSKNTLTAFATVKQYVNTQAILATS